MKTRLTALPIVTVGVLIGLAGLMDGGNPTWQRALYGLGLCGMLAAGLRAILPASKRVGTRVVDES
jgi:hypothetical protein